MFLANPTFHAQGWWSQWWPTQAKEGLNGPPKALVAGVGSFVISLSTRPTEFAAPTASRGRRDDKDLKMPMLSGIHLAIKTTENPGLCHYHLAEARTVRQSRCQPTNKYYDPSPSVS